MKSKIIDLFNYVVNISDSNGKTIDIGIVAMDDAQARKVARKNAIERYGFKNPKINYVDYNNIDDRFRLRFHIGYGNKKSKIEIIRKA